MLERISYSVAVENKNGLLFIIGFWRSIGII
ncbi:hypothetical protein EMGBS15_06260, partial [Filimonas sp.]